MVPLLHFSSGCVSDGKGIYLFIQVRGQGPRLYGGHTYK